jgi:KipI family sensor histidine kinase inhibitor
MKTEPYASAKYMPFGDSALLIEFGNAINLEINHKVIALNEAIIKAEIREVEELVPTYRSLLIRYDPLRTTYEQLVSRIRDIERTLSSINVRIESRKITIPVIYGGEYGPDLSYVAKCHGLSEKQVVKLHSEREYTVYMIGFVAGFPYLGEASDEIATPRLETPRLKVPAGSVGIAEKQTGIYPCEAPGGWRIIGRTPTRLFDPSQQPPALLGAGDKVKFEPISMKTFIALQEAIAKDARLTFFEGPQKK